MKTIFYRQNKIPLRRLDNLTSTLYYSKDSYFKDSHFAICTNSYSEFKRINSIDGRDFIIYEFFDGSYKRLFVSFNDMGEMS